MQSFGSLQLPEVDEEEDYEELHCTRCFIYFINLLTVIHLFYFIIRHLIIYTIILLRYVCLSVFANCRSQFFLDRLERCLKLFVSSDSTSCHEFASLFGLAIFYAQKTSKTSGISGRQRACVYLSDPATGYECQRSGPSRLGANE